MPQAPVELAVQGVPEASHCGVVTGERLRRDHLLHLVPRRDAVQPSGDDGAHLVPLLLVVNVWAEGLRADIRVPVARLRSSNTLKVSISSAVPSVAFLSSSLIALTMSVRR